MKEAVVGAVLMFELNLFQIFGQRNDMCYVVLKLFIKGINFLCNTWLINVICLIYILTFLIYPDHCISYMSDERLHGAEQFRSKKCPLEMTPSHAIMHLKSAPEKLNNDKTS